MPKYVRVASVATFCLFALAISIENAEPRGGGSGFRAVGSGSAIRAGGGGFARFGNTGFSRSGFVRGGPMSGSSRPITSCGFANRNSTRSAGVRSFTRSVGARHLTQSAGSQSRQLTSKNAMLGANSANGRFANRNGNLVSSLVRSVGRASLLRNMPSPRQPAQRP